MKKSAAALLAALLLAAASFPASAARPYKWAEGFSFQPASYRGVCSAGVVVKQFLTDNTNLDYSLAYNFNVSSQFTLFYEWNTPLPFLDGLSAYYGPGAHLGFASRTSTANIRHTTYGIAGVGGAEYLIPYTPLTVALDWRPQLVFRTGYGDCIFDANCFCLSLKIYY